MGTTRADKNIKRTGESDQTILLSQWDEFKVKFFKTFQDPHLIRFETLINNA